MGSLEPRCGAKLFHSRNFVYNQEMIFKRTPSFLHLNPLFRNHGSTPDLIFHFAYLFLYRCWVQLCVDLVSGTISYRYVRVLTIYIDYHKLLHDMDIYPKSVKNEKKHVENHVILK